MRKGSDTLRSERASDPRRLRSVVFDLGGVLIEWNPRHLYRQLFDDEDAMERFLVEVTSPEWNRRQDAGRPWAEAIAELVAAHPEQRELIVAYRARWHEMLGGPIEGSLDVLADVRSTGRAVYALSNWSAETFAQARGTFPFLDWFDGLLISGEVGLVKPDPRIFELLAARFGIAPEETVLVDDQAENVNAAARLGFVAIRFCDAPQLRRDLEAIGVLDGDGGSPMPAPA